MSQSSQSRQHKRQRCEYIDDQADHSDSDSCPDSVDNQSNISDLIDDDNEIMNGPIPMNYQALVQRESEEEQLTQEDEEVSRFPLREIHGCQDLLRGEEVEDEDEVLRGEEVESEEVENEEVDEECLQTWGFDVCTLRQLKNSNDAGEIENLFQKIYRGFLLKSKGNLPIHGSQVSMLCMMAEQDTGFFDRSTLDRIFEYFENFLTGIAENFPGPFLNEDDNEKSWDDLIELVDINVDIIAEEIVVAEMRNDKIESGLGELSDNMKLKELIIHKLKKDQLFVSRADKLVYRKLQDSGKFMPYTIMQDDNGRPTQDFLVYLRGLQSARNFKNDVDCFEISKMLSSRVSNDYLNNFSNYFIINNPQVLRKRINFIRFKDFGIDQNTLKIYKNEEIGKNWFPMYSYLDISLEDVTIPIDLHGEHLHGIVEYDDNDAFIEERKQYRMERLKQRIELSQKFDSSSSNLILSLRAGHDRRIFYSDYSRHLYRIYEDQQWDNFMINLRMILLARSWFWHYVKEVRDIEDESNLTTKKGPLLGEGGDNVAACIVDYGASAAGKSTTAKFISDVNESACKNIRADGINQSFWVSQISEGTTLNLVFDELSNSSPIPVTDWLAAVEGGQSDADVKHVNQLKHVDWIYSILMICNDGQFPESLCDNFDRLQRRVIPFVYSKGFGFQSDETIGKKLAKYKGYIHLESVVQRRIFRLDCKELGIEYNYQKYIEIRDTNNSMHASKLAFFGAMKKFPLFEIFKKHDFIIGSQYYMPIRNVHNSVAGKGDYESALNDYVDTVSLEYANCGHDATEIEGLLLQHGVKKKNRPLSNETKGEITMLSFEDFCVEESYRCDFINAVKVQQTARFYFQTQEIEVRENVAMHWPPGSGLALKSDFVVGIAYNTQNTRNLYSQEGSPYISSSCSRLTKSVRIILNSIRDHHSNVQRIIAKFNNHIDYRNFKTIVEDQEGFFTNDQLHQIPYENVEDFSNRDKKLELFTLFNF